MIAGLILAGGSGRRLGGIDKPLLEIGGTSILARIAAALDLPRMAISANGDPARFAAFGLPVLPDGAWAGQGPLAGVLTGLLWAGSIGAEALLTVPGDTPFIPRGLAARLAPGPSRATSGGREHHLVALWPTATAEPLRAWLSEPGPRHAGRFAAAIGARRVDFPVSPWDPFLNINTQEDLERVRSLLATTESPL